MIQKHDLLGHNMAKLAKEATTMRRVLESLFRYFEYGNLWSPEHGLAFPVLQDMQLFMDNSAQDSKAEPSLAIIGALSDVMRHLRKSIHCSLDDTNLGADIIKWNRSFREVVDDCLVQLSHKVGDAGPILDVMAVMLENISTITVIARTTISAAFPEALFHQLLLAMVHPDHETRIGAHRIFSVVLVPSSVCPRSSSSIPETKKASDLPRTLSRTVSVFSSSAALFEKLRKEKFSSNETAYQDNKENGVSEEEPRNINNGMLTRLKSSYSRVYSMKSPLVSMTTDGNAVINSNKEMEVNSLRLSSHQITLLLSSIWAQSISPANSPDNYEAIAHTHGLVLLFSRAKVDPFLRLVEDCKLQAVKTGSHHPSNVYGSKEDDGSASKSLSEIEITQDQTRESFASEIVKSLENLSESELSTIREQLLNEFLPEDVCPLGSQLFMGSPHKICQVDQKNSESVKEVAPIFSMDDDLLADSFESQTKHNSESWRRHIKEMARHCEALLMGKQQKMSNVMIVQQKQESRKNCTLQIYEPEVKMSSYPWVDVGSYGAGNPFLDESFVTNSGQQSPDPVPMPCATEYQHHPHFFRLPASSPYDNFLKAAGC
ncbi:protein EFR3 homolog B [Fagus crenata]